MSLFELDPDLIVRLILAVVYGGLIGFEREASGRAAGLRTVILVCLGATLMTVLSITLPRGTDDELARAIVRMDPGRISAGIVTGVGFLGGAVVIKLGELIRGVTTAATIWFAAGLGIALGQGHYALATWATVIALLVLTVFPILSRSVPTPVYRRIWVRLDGDLDTRREEISALLEASRVRVMDVHARHDATADGAGSELTFHIRCAQSLPASRVVAQLSRLDGVGYVRWA